MSVGQAIRRAAQMHQQGRLDEAERDYAAVLAAQPRHFDALHMVGLLRFQQGRYPEALAYLSAALNENPGATAVLASLGDVHAKLNRPDLALASYDRALALRPDDPEALNNRGNALEALNRLDEAVASFDAALALKPDNPEALNNRGVALQELGRLDAAVASFDAALALRPDDPETWNNRGVALQELARLDEALANFDRALALLPDYAEAFNNRGIVLMRLGQFEPALACYEKALALQPAFAEAFNNRGNVLQELKRFDAAVASYDAAIALRPDYAEAFSNRGNALLDMRRLDEAVASYDRAVMARPGYANARHGRSLCRLVQGDFARGWAEYESRWDTAQMQPGKRHFAEPLWLGDEDIAGMSILLHGEQGFGDTLQFCRFAIPVAQRGATVIVEVQAPLKHLVASLDPAIPVIGAGEALPAFDRHCPLMSLPLALKITPETIPAQRPYLSAPAAKRQRWRDRLGPGLKPRVGLAWAGSPRPGMFDANRIDRQRSIAFAQLAPLFGAADCQFYSLQKGGEAAAQLRGSSLGSRVIDWTDELADFSDTAALVANLDLVITVDTAMAHLAGALGKPFWLMNRFNTCWRWGLEGTSSPWYPTARIFRQPSIGAWSPVMASVASALRRWCEAESTAAASPDRTR